MKTKTDYLSPQLELLQTIYAAGVVCQSSGISSSVDDYVVDTDDIKF